MQFGGCIRLGCEYSGRQVECDSEGRTVGFRAVRFAEDSETQAVDQAAEFGGIEKAAASYRDNVADTLVENGIGVDEFNRALAAFDRAVRQGIKARNPNRGNH